MVERSAAGRLGLDVVRRGARGHPDRRGRLPSVFDPRVAAKSCLYWAWWRRNRRAADLSHGWGHNSQWGTDFRRDYVVGDELHYNVDGGDIVPEHEDDFTPDLRRSLLRFRHSTTVDLGSDRWPYEERFVERRS